MTKLERVIFNYFKNIQLRTGVYKTPLYVLYWEYTRYCRRAGARKVSPIELSRKLSLYFQKGKSGRYSYYLTNLEPPSAKRKRQIRFWYDRIWSRMRNDKKKKNTSKIPKS